jgi:PIN domain nuclease of toxin-antitoxin system
MIVLDTHVWIWWVSNPEHLSPPAKQEIDNAMENGEILISSISVWEVALLLAKDRLKLTMSVSDWVSKSESLPFVRFVPVDNTIAIRSVSLPEPIHDDLADRIIIATANTLNAALLTKDEKILKYPNVQTIW